MNLKRISKRNRPVCNFYLSPNDKIITWSKIPKKFIKWATEAWNKWQKEVGIYQNVDVRFVDSQDKTVGCYIDGTSFHPLIFIHFPQLINDSRSYNMEANFKITLYHELGHAICDLQREIGLNYKIVQNEQHEENLVERFAYNLHFDSMIVPKAQWIINAIKSTELVTDLVGMGGTRTAPY